MPTSAALARGIVYAIAGHGHDGLLLLPCFDDSDFIGRSGSGENTNLLNIGGQCFITI